MYGVFTLQSSLGCVARLATAQFEFVREMLVPFATEIGDCLMRIVEDFCVEGGIVGGIAGGGREDARAASLAVEALDGLTEYLVEYDKCGDCAAVFAFDAEILRDLWEVLLCFETCCHSNLTLIDRDRSKAIRHRIIRKI